MTETFEYVLSGRAGGRRAKLEAHAAGLLADGWIEVTNDPAYGPPIPGIRKFNRPARPEAGKDPE